MKPRKILCLALALLMLLPLVACTPSEKQTTDSAATTGAPQSTTAPSTDAPTGTTGTTATTGTTSTEENTTQTPPPEENLMDIYLDDLNFSMKPIFSGNYVREESVMFLEYGEEKELLFPIDRVVTVTAYDRITKYKEGVDYAIVDGKIKILEGSAIPCIGKDNYYGVGDGTLKTLVNGQYVNTKFSNMHPWQILVTYEHTSTWEGFWPAAQTETFLPLIEKLKNGEDLTFFFYGDSITTGAEAKHNHGYHVLFTEAVASLFGYTVDYVDVKGNGISGTISNYKDKVSFGDNGTITCLNAAVGGWWSGQGVENFDVYVKPFLKQYGCDLFINAFGMNNPSTHEQNASTHAYETVLEVKKLAPNASFLLVSTMVPNPGATNRWHINQYKQEPYFLDVAAKLCKNGTPCAIAQMTSMSRSILEIKDFHDYSGNNINHPNDFFHRVYAQVLLQTFIGYENLLTAEE